LQGNDYERALITLHHCDAKTLARIGIGSAELEDLILQAGVTTPELIVIGGEAPPPRTSWTPRDFLGRFTRQERINIRAAARQEPLMEDYLDMLRTARRVYADDIDTLSGMDQLVQAGLITEARRAEILAPDEGTI